MKTAPVATLFGPAILPVFDDRWKAMCDRCKHVRKATGPEGGAEWRCAVTQPSRWSRHLSYCIDAREEGPQKCGPGGALFHAR